MNETVIKPTKKTAIKINELLDYGLTSGLGSPMPGEMCVEAAVCYALGIKHSDNPPCVSRAVREFKIGLNDANWSSNKARAEGMRKLAIAQLGSNEIDDVAFVKYLTLGICRKMLPEILRIVAKNVPQKNADELNTCADKLEGMEDLDAASYAASDAARAASDARAARAASAASYAASAASYAASDARAAARAASDARAAARAASDAARAAARAASDARAASYAASAASDRILSMVADIGLEALRLCKSPGCKWVNLAK